MYGIVSGHFGNPNDVCNENQLVCNKNQLVCTKETGAIRVGNVRNQLVCNKNQHVCNKNQLVSTKKTRADQMENCQAVWFFSGHTTVLPLAVAGDARGVPSQGVLTDYCFWPGGRLLPARLHPANF